MKLDFTTPNKCIASIRSAFVDMGPLTGVNADKTESASLKHSLTLKGLAEENPDKWRIVYGHFLNIANQYWSVRHDAVLELFSSQVREHLQGDTVSRIDVPRTVFSLEGDMLPEAIMSYASVAKNVSNGNILTHRNSNIIKKSIESYGMSLSDSSWPGLNDSSYYGTWILYTEDETVSPSVVTSFTTDLSEVEGATKRFLESVGLESFLARDGYITADLPMIVRGAVEGILESTCEFSGCIILDSPSKGAYCFANLFFRLLQRDSVHYGEDFETMPCLIVIQDMNQGDE